MPGGNDEATEVPDNTDTELKDLGASNMHARLYAFYPDKKKLYSSQTIGRVTLDNELTLKELVTVLCDTGALSANYVAKDLVDKLRKKIGNEARSECPYLQKYRRILRVGYEIQRYHLGIASSYGKVVPVYGHSIERGSPEY